LKITILKIELLRFPAQGGHDSRLNSNGNRTSADGVFFAGHESFQGGPVSGTGRPDKTLWQPQTDTGKDPAPRDSLFKGAAA